MRMILLPLLAALGGCNAAEQASSDAGNSAVAAGNAAESAGGAMVNAVAQGADSVRNEIGQDGVDRDGWVGRWRGVEGTYLVVSKADRPGHYKLEMQYTLDDKGNFDGLGTDQGISFLRTDGTHTLRASDGDATGLKYLAGKKECLTVKSGEGYCRD
jgi:hypothetical protein